VNDPLRFVRSDFDELEVYTPVLPFEELVSEIGLPADQIVKLDANENLHGPDEAVLRAIREADFHIYPDPGAAALRRDLGEYLGVTPESIVAGAGSDDLIDIIIRLVMPRAVVTTPPTFGMYGFLARIARSGVVEAPRIQPGYALDIPAITRAVDAGASIVFVASPNNPTGNAATDAEVEALGQVNALVVLDEAYAEFSQTSAVAAIQRYPNLVVLRTFSKWAGLAGLRIGYAVAHPALCERMMAIKQPYNVNVAADVAARAALRHRGAVMETVRMLIAERSRLVEALRPFPWLKPNPSQANFVLFNVEGRSAGELAAALRTRGVLVRHYNRPDLRDCIRISAGRPRDTDRLVQVLSEVAHA